MNKPGDEDTLSSKPDHPYTNEGEQHSDSTDYRGDTIKPGLIKGNEEDNLVSRSNPTSKDWEYKIFIDAQIVQINDMSVHLDCLINEEKEEFEERVFDRDLIEEAVDLNIGEYVIIKIFQNPGEQVIRINQGDESVQKEAFSNDIDLSDVEDDVFNQKIEIEEL